MKNSLLSGVRGILLLTAAAGAWACDDKEEGAASDEPKFGITVIDKTMSSLKVAVDPGASGQTYYVSVDNKADFDARFATDEEYFDMKLKFIGVMAGVHGMSVAEYLAGELKSGACVHEETDLYYDTEYYVCVFGLNAAGEITAPLTRQAVRTETFQPSASCRFVIQLMEATTSTLRVVVGASDPAVRYYVDAMPEEELNGYDSVNEAVSDLIFSAELFDDVDWSDPSFTCTGRNELLLADLEAGTTYAVIAFGVSADGEQTTEAEVARFATAAE